MFVLDLSTIPPPERERIQDLYTRYRASMYRVAFSVLHNEAQAEDAVQQAFVSLIQSSQKLNKISADKLPGYVVIVVRNAAINLYRKNKRSNAVPLEDYMEAAEDGESVEELVLREDTIARLRQAIRELPPIYADTMTLRYQRDFSIGEIAALLGVSEGTVRARLHEGKERLIKLLGKEAEPVDR